MIRVRDVGCPTTKKVAGVSAFSILLSEQLSFTSTSATYNLAHFCTLSKVGQVLEIKLKSLISPKRIQLKLNAKFSCVGSAIVFLVLPAADTFTKR